MRVLKGMIPFLLCLYYFHWSLFI